MAASVQSKGYILRPLPLPLALTGLFVAFMFCWRKYWQCLTLKQSKQHTIRNMEKAIMPISTKLKNILLNAVTHRDSFKLTPLQLSNLQSKPVKTPVSGLKTESRLRVTVRLLQTYENKGWTDEVMVRAKLYTGVFVLELYLPANLTLFALSWAEFPMLSLTTWTQFVQKLVRKVVKGAQVPYLVFESATMLGLVLRQYQLIIEKVFMHLELGQVPVLAIPELQVVASWLTLPWQLTRFWYEVEWPGTHTSCQKILKLPLGQLEVKSDLSATVLKQAIWLIPLAVVVSKSGMWPNPVLSIQVESADNLVFMLVVISVKLQFLELKTDVFSWVTYPERVASVTVMKSLVPPKHYEKYVEILEYWLPTILLIISVKELGSVKVLEKQMQLQQVEAMLTERKVARAKRIIPSMKQSRHMMWRRYLHPIILKHFTKITPRRASRDNPITVPYSAKEYVTLQESMFFNCSRLGSNLVSAWVTLLYTSARIVSIAVILAPMSPAVKWVDTPLAAVVIVVRLVYRVFVQAQISPRRVVLSLNIPTLGPNRLEKVPVVGELWRGQLQV